MYSVNSFKILLTNSDTFTQYKLQELKLRIEDSNPSIIAISEVKPKNYKRDIQISEFNIDGYEILSANLSKSSPGRGMLMYIKDSLKYSPYNISISTFEENLLCEIQVGNNEKILVGSLYRSPNGSEENFTQLCELFTESVKKRFSEVILFGDLNFPNITWDTCSTNGTIDSKEFRFIETIRDCYLYQHITAPTRGRGSDKPSVIDLVFTSEEEFISDITINPPLGKSDHSVIELICKISEETSVTKKTRFKYDKGDYEKLKEMLDLNWEKEFEKCNVHEQWNKFREILEKAMEEAIPKKVINQNGKRKKDDNHPVPLNRKALSKIKRKERLWTRYLNTRDGQVYSEYCKIRNQVRAITRKITKEYEKQIAQQVKENPKKFWKYARSKTKTKSSIPDLFKDASQKESTTTDKEKADVLAEFFTSVFTNETDTEMPKVEKVKVPPLETMKINVEKIKKKLDKMNISKSPGPDGIHPRVLREISSTISTPIAIIFQTSISTGELPEDWKCANITALFKKGNKKVAGNYRPVSLTSIICKLMESLVREEIIEHMKRHKLFSKRQFGFISGRSTVLQLLQVMDKWTEILDRGGCVDVVYCDFMKAFDKVPHLRLLHKLDKYQITGQYNTWIRSFLLGRKQRVIVNGEKSEWKDVTSGIPQGSVLGPILFVLYINDMPEVTSIGTDTYLFADDTKAFRGIFQQSDCEHLQEDIHALHEWSEKWLLCFHPDKCKVMRIGRSKVEQKAYTLKEGITPMEYVEAEKDIGVTIDTKLSFEQHMHEKINKANSIMGILRRTMEYMDMNTFKLLYTALVRPHLEYANQVWCPHLKKQIEAIENVQRRATKQIPGLSTLTYEERLRKLKLPTLAYRRSRGDMIEMYKILSGKYDDDVSDFISPCTDSNTRGHHLKLYKTRSRLDVRKYTFTQRAVEIWNSLPEKVVSAPTIPCFEARLDRYWENQTQKYNYSEKIHTTGQDLSKKSLDKELTEEDSSGILQSEEDL